MTAADLELMPDDGHRYELIDGTLIVTPSPAVPHQRIVGNLHVLLRAGVAEHLEVMLAPLDITVSDITVLQPDLLVAGRETLTGRKMVGLPVLAVEVLSPSTRLIDLNLKKAAFERAGVESYWVVDPDRPSITVWQLTDGVYAEVATAAGDETLAPDAPFPLTLTPSDLVR
ncbi:Uma2 family endonuclease [Nocardioides sp. B-3]|uniref:Uma2 family endonuclease n=1 Tax=Nocardioides sp. B-3 TaxID=2895565 RepID=UPI0021532699|nr:Uma2 family endonuclease [Nocardioides sp. B-3]UUZ57765.1 Uma2 family endonuclease [Nocardioides sp. B-3]